MFGQDWARQGLRPGDLTMLAGIGKSARISEEDRLKRLSRRGFVKVASDGSASVTAKGRLALLAKKLGSR